MEFPMPANDNKEILDELREVRIELGIIQGSLKSDKPEKEEPKSLGKSITQIVSIVAVVFGIFYTVSQTINQFAATEKTTIDSELSLLEIEEKRIKIQEAVRELAKKDRQDLLDKGAEARALLREIDQTLSALKAAENAFRVDDMITKFIFLWAAFLFLGLVSDVVTQCGLVL
jgi:hypothetical protein